MHEFTILMPCLNEAKSLAFCIEQAKRGIDILKLDAEILIADNGSVDGSVEIAVHNGARVIKVKKKGYGEAIIGGIKAASGKYIIMGDADGSYDFGNLEAFVAELRNGYALVMGNRFWGGIEKGAMPISHMLGVKILSALAGRRFAARQIGDFHSGLRAFDREKALELNFRCPGMEFATEMVARFAMSGARITEVPTSLRRDKRGGKSHLRTVRDGMRHLCYIIFEKSGK